MSLSFPLPPLTDGGAAPIWEKNQFRIGEEFTRILQYSINTCGWNDELTHLHEETAGEQHFIDRASRDQAIRQLHLHLPNIEKATILEVGCSSGHLLKRLNNAFPQTTIIGSDIVDEPLRRLATELPNTPLFRFDFLDCPLPDNSVDAVIMLNVLEHIEDDAAIFKQISRILKPNGIAIFEVPAGPHLFDIYDKVLMHFRRYTLANLCGLAKNQGLKVIHKSHLGFFIYPAFWFVKKRNQRLLSAPEQLHRELTEKSIRSTGSSKLFHFIMRVEIFLSKLISYPIGIRCLMTCKKAN